MEPCLLSPLLTVHVFLRLHGSVQRPGRCALAPLFAFCPSSRLRSRSRSAPPKTTWPVCDPLRQESHLSRGGSQSGSVGDFPLSPRTPAAEPHASTSLTFRQGGGGEEGRARQGLRPGVSSLLVCSLWRGGER